MKDPKKEYEKPEIILEMELETQAGSSSNPVMPNPFPDVFEP